MSESRDNKKNSKPVKPKIVGEEDENLVTLGARFDDRVNGNVAKFAPDAEIIHIDIDPASIAKIIDVDIPVVGDAKSILTELYVASHSLFDYRHRSLFS